ncbi:MAG: efflux RND transporter periplasmic adaptor subunit [Alphaproteobacteria bacterium]|nr:efflux RND transporter periplasmic adaptor subunit [Alphaproteobacteria bacterium]
MGSRSKWTAFGVATVAMLGCAWWLFAARADTRPPYRTHTVALGSVESTVSAVGTLQPLNYVDVGTQVSGQLKKILVDNGEKVKEGQLIAQIDPTVYEARVAASEAQLLNFRAQIMDKQVQLDLARIQFERQRRLMVDRATSQEAFEIADAQRKSLGAQIAVLEAQVKQTESTLKADRANLSYTNIYAPMAGTVVEIIARQGGTLNANQQAPIVLKIADLDTMTVKSQVSEADVQKLAIHMPAYFTTLGQPDRKRTGKLRQVLPTPEVVNNVVLYSALFDVENPTHDLLPQMSAQVFFVVGQVRDVPVVPMSLLKPVPRMVGRYTTRVVGIDGPVERQIDVGVTDRVTAEIKSGLAVGDEIAIDAPPARSTNSLLRLLRL